MTTLEIILTLCTTLLGGSNIVTLLQVRQIKRKAAEEANQESNKTLFQIIEGNAKEIQRLQSRLDAAEQRVRELTDEIFTLRHAMSNNSVQNSKKRAANQRNKQSHDR